MWHPRCLAALPADLSEIVEADIQTTCIPFAPHLKIKNEQRHFCVILSFTVQQ